MAGRASRYLAGLSVGAAALVAAGLLVLAPFAFGYRGREMITGVVTGAALALVAVITLICWSVAWRKRLRADGVLPPARSRAAKRSERRQARAERLVRSTRHRELAVAPDPAQVLTELRDLLIPLLADRSVLTDRVVLREDEPSPPPDGAALDEILDSPVRDAVQDAAVQDAVAGAHASHVVQAPGQLRGTRSASFLAAPAPDSPVRYGNVRPVSADELLRGAELLVVGSGEEESW